MSRTLTLIKPGVLRAGRGLELIAEISRKFTPEALRMLTLSPGAVHELYRVHAHQPWFGEVVDHLTSGPCVAAVWSHPIEAPQRMTDWVGFVDPLQAAPGTLRARYGESIARNAIHSSETELEAAREAQLLLGAHLLPRV